jgi:hypothetical protein
MTHRQTLQADYDEGGLEQLLQVASAALNYRDAEIKRLRDALGDAIEGWEDGANYKGDYLRKKHGDAEGIAKAKALLRTDTNRSD